MKRKFLLIVYGLILCALAAACDGNSSDVVAGEDLTIDLGNGVVMEFVWIEDLNGWAGKYEVTNAEYRRYDPRHNSGVLTTSWSGGVPQNAYPLDGDRQPVVQVTINEAEQFAGWLTCKLDPQQKIRAKLPSSDEWLTFARCGDDRTYPWGNTWPPDHGNYRDWTLARELEWPDCIRDYDDGFTATCPVTHSGVNDWGLYGVGGNVAEWVSGEEIEGYPVRLGSSWASGDPDSLKCTMKSISTGSPKVDIVGFRVIIVIEGGSPETDIDSVVDDLSGPVELCDSGEHTDLLRNTGRTSGRYGISVYRRRGRVLS